MSELLIYIVLFALHGATICFLLGMLFIHQPRRWWLRGVTVAVAVAAIAMPVYSMVNMLGYPDPWPPPGEYRIIGWEIDEGDAAFYLFVEEDGDPVPRNYKMPFNLKTALDLQEAQERFGTYKRISLFVHERKTGEEPTFNITFEKVFSDDPPEEGG